MTTEVRLVKKPPDVIVVWWCPYCEETWLRTAYTWDHASRCPMTEPERKVYVLA